MKKIFWIFLPLTLVVLPVFYILNLPNTDELKKTNPQTWAIRDFREEQIRKKGQTPHSIAEWRSLDQISPNLWHAVLLAEDDGFFMHHGFDMIQLKAAARTNWKRKKFAFGASTLTQQLARTLYLSPSKNLMRKAKEALITRKLEKSLPKKRILELYLNTVEWGPQIFGAEAASQHFFGKPVSDLTPEEGIALAAILPSPRKWNPKREEGFMARRKAILYDRMVRENYIAPPISPDITESSETLVEPIFDEIPAATPTPTLEEPASASEELPTDNGEPDKPAAE